MSGGRALLAAASLTVFGMTVAILATQGVEETGLRTALRATARTSASLFLLVFLAQALRRWRKNGFTAWLVENERYVGLSFVASHLIHLGLIVWLFGGGKNSEPLDLGVVGGGLAYLFIAAMSAQWLNLWARPPLAALGIYWVWFVFIATFGQDIGLYPLALPFALALAVALPLRLWLLRHRQPLRDGVAS